MMRSSNFRCCAYFDVIFEEQSTFEVSFQEEDKFCVNFGQLTVISVKDYYDGDYIITPKDHDQIFETDEKTMRYDLTVLAVPYTEVSNVSGGITCIIGI